MVLKLPIRGVLIAACLLAPTEPRAAAVQGPDEELPSTSEEVEWVTYEVRDAQLEEAVWDVLRSAASGETESTVALRRLADHGPQLVPLLFGILTGEAQEPAVEEEARPEWEGAELVHRKLRPGSVDALVYAALAEQPPAVVVEHLEGTATGEAPTEIRVLAARVLALTGGPKALGVMLEILSSMDPLQLQRPFLRGPFEAAVAEILRRHPAGLRDLSARLEDEHVQLTLLVVDALPAELVADGVPFVLGLFARDDELDLALMEQLANLASSPQAAGDSWASLDCRQAVRTYLRAEDWRMRCRAAVAVAKLHDIESLETLIKMFEDEHRSVQRTALWSLREMTGKTFEADTVQWSRWVAAERAWFAGPRAEVEWQILSGEDEQIIAGLRALILHPLFRDSAADLLGPLLPDASPAVFGAIVGLLTQLQSPHAAHHLVACLGVADEFRSDGAWRALKDLTQLSLPQERAAWKQSLGI